MTTHTSMLLCIVPYPHASLARTPLHRLAWPRGHLPFTSLATCMCAQKTIKLACSLTPLRFYTRPEDAPGPSSRSSSPRLPNRSRPQLPRRPPAVYAQALLTWPSCMGFLPSHVHGQFLPYGAPCSPITPCSLQFLQRTRPTDKPPARRSVAVAADRPSSACIQQTCTPPPTAAVCSIPWQISFMHNDLATPNSPCMHVVHISC